MGVREGRKEVREGADDFLCSGYCQVEGTVGGETDRILKPAKNRGLMGIQWDLDGA